MALKKQSLMTALAQALSLCGTDDGTAAIGRGHHRYHLCPGIIAVDALPRPALGRKGCGKPRQERDSDQQRSHG